jgi:hypothetical protein
MGFEKGNSYGGRSFGSKNKVTQRVRETFEDLLCENIDQLKEDFKVLNPIDRIKLFLELSNYIIPKLKSVEVDHFNSEIDDLDLLTDEELEEKYKKIINEEIIKTKHPK